MDTIAAMGKLNRMLSGRSVAAAQSQHLSSQESSRVGSSVDGASQEQREMWRVPMAQEAPGTGNLEDIESGVWRYPSVNNRWHFSGLLHQQTASDAVPCGPDF